MIAGTAYPAHPGSADDVIPASLRGRTDGPQDNPIGPTYHDPDLAGPGDRVENLKITQK